MARRALLVIDVQNEYFTGKLPITHPAGHFDRILRAMDEAARAAVPVVLIQHEANHHSPIFARGSDSWQIHPKVASRHHDFLVAKELPGSFTGTELDLWLRGEGVDTVAIAGYMTHMCCDTTARQAMHRGFQVEFLADATGTLALENAAGSVSAEELHRSILCAQQMMISEVIDLETWAGRLSAST
ncbi:MAG: cysteine hydrolase family protein [Isosphaeraceae bacterium]